MVLWALPEKQNFCLEGLDSTKVLKLGLLSAIQRKYEEPRSAIIVSMHLTCFYIN